MYFYLYEQVRSRIWIWFGDYVEKVFIVHSANYKQNDNND